MPRIVALGPNSWTTPWRNRQQILSRLAARGWPVVYSSGPMRTWEVRSGSWRTTGWLPRFAEHDGVTCLFPGRIPPLSGRPRAYKELVLSMYARWLRGRTRTDHPRLLYVFGPKNRELVEHIRPDRLVYHAFDRFAVPDPATGQLRADPQEAEMLAMADLVIASSEPIAEGLRRAGRPDVRVLPNGADYAAYSAPAAAPADLGDIPHPRIGYFGRINLKIDLDLIDAVAAARPDVHWVVVGEVYEQVLRAHCFGACLDRLRARPNVHFLGYRPHTAMPAYAQAMDVLAMVYQTKGGGWWEAVYPLKMHEYLATGKPVISTPIPTVQPFDSVIDVRDGPADWLTGLDRALAGDGVATPAMRQAVAFDNTWDKRIDTLETWLRDLVA